MFWCNYLVETHWQFHCTQFCRYDAIGQCNPFEQLMDPMLKVFLLITERLKHSTSILFFFCRDEKLSIFTSLLVLTRPRHYAQAWALHITRYNYLCQFFIHVCRLGACQYTSRWEHNPSCKVLNIAPSIFSIPWLLRSLETYYIHAYSIFLHTCKYAKIFLHTCKYAVVCKLECKIYI